MNNKKLIIEAYILYCLGNNQNCAIHDIYHFMEQVDGETSDDEAKSRRLRRYLEDLKDIGALLPETRVGLVKDYIDPEIENVTAIPCKNYSANLVPYASLKDHSLKTLHHLATILNSTCGSDVFNDDTYDRFKESYFNDYFPRTFDNEEILRDELMIIYEMLKADEELNDSHISFDASLYKNCNDLLLKLKTDYGYNL